MTKKIRKTLALTLAVASISATTATTIHSAIANPAVYAATKTGLGLSDIHW